MSSALVLLSAAAVALSPLQRAADLADSVGMNVHIEYTDGGYRDLARVMDCLNFVGVRHVRDAAPNPANQGQGGYAALGKAGIKYDLFVNGEPIKAALSRLEALQQEAPASVVSIEGPNEVNNDPGFRFGAEPDLHKAAVAYQEALFGAVKADAKLRHLPVLEFTDYPFTTARADIANEHIYPAGDKAPGEQVWATAQGAAARSPRHEVVFTELGFSTSRAAGDVSALAQARLLLSSLLEAGGAGVRRTYVYQLLDAYPDPGGGEHEKHFGVFDIAYAPKPAARALRRVAALLEDSSPQARTFAPKALRTSVSSDASDVRSLLMQKASGEQVIALWRRVPVFDASKGGDLAVEQVAVDLRLPDPHGEIVVSDPVASTRGRLSATSPLIRVPVGADPVFLTIAPAAPAPQGEAPAV